MRTHEAKLPADCNRGLEGAPPARLESVPVAGIARRPELRLRARSLCLALVVLAVLTPKTAFGQSRTVRVGVYQNEPKIFMDQNGRASGIFIELLEEIGVREGWTLEYVPCEWADCLLALEDGADRPDAGCRVFAGTGRQSMISIRPRSLKAGQGSIRPPKRRSMRMPIWMASGSPCFKGSIQQTVFQQLMDGFGYQVTLVPAGSFGEAFQMAANGSADAAIANTFFGDYFYQDYGLVKDDDRFPAGRSLLTQPPRGAITICSKPSIANWASGFRTPGSPYYTTLGRWTEQDDGLSCAAVLLSG